MRVVIVEDEGLFLDALVDGLTARQVEVAGRARSADEALTVINRCAPDVAVLDIRMPPTFTDEGLRVVTWAHRILAERDELLADVKRMRGRLTATARIGAIPTAVPTSPLLTTQFLQDNPDATVRVEAFSSREIARRLADFEIDAAGAVKMLKDEPVESQKTEPLRFAAPLRRQSGIARRYYKSQTSWAVMCAGNKRPGSTPFVR